jgi:hypothetical protein
MGSGQKWWADNGEEFEKEQKKREQEQIERDKKLAEEHPSMMAKFRVRLINAGLTPKQADNLLYIAWQEGHCYGYHEVQSNADDFVTAMEDK